MEISASLFKEPIVAGLNDRKRQHEDEDDEEERSQRGRTEEYEDENGGSSSRGFSVADIGNDDLDKDRINEIIDQLPEIEVPVLDVNSLRKMILKLEKLINKNQQLRLKYPDQPDKFMESEVDLDEELKHLQILATAPQLYDQLVALGAVPSLLSLLSHENTDIAINIVDLIKELTDADTSANEQDTINTLIDAMLGNDMLQLLFQNLKRLNETSPEESQGVFNTLALIENLTEVRQSIGELVVSQTDFLTWALQRVSVRPFDQNKLYCSELLVILLQNSKANRTKLGELNGIDTLLKALSFYKKKDPSSPEEIELLENLFDALCSSLLDPDNKELFLKGEGLELMILIIGENKLARKGALKALSYATADPDAIANCNRFVEVHGLRVFFPVFMRRGLKKLKKQYKDNYSEVQEEEHTISILAQLMRYVNGSRRDRLLSKFVENEYEKTDHLLELHFKYATKLEAVEEQIDREKQEIKESGEELDAEDNEEFYLRRLDGGLFHLQLVDLSLAYICTCEEPLLREHLVKSLRLKGSSLRAITRTLREFATVVGETAPEVIRDKQRAEVHTLIEQLETEPSSTTTSS